jgi:beta-lactamase class A
MSGLTGKMGLTKHFIAYLLALALVLGIYSATAEAQSKPTRFDISYVWTSNLGRALDYMKEVKGSLKSESSRKLIIVKRKPRSYGVIYDLNSDRDFALTTVEKHNKLLQSAGLESACIIEDKGYHDLYNVNYGESPDLEDLKEKYTTVSRRLGPAVTRDLVIERTLDGYAIVYKRLGDKDSSMVVARRHTKLLRSKGIVATIIRETNNDIFYGESSYLDQLIETETLYNISYGVGPYLDVQKKNYAKICQVLGDEVSRNLVIQKTSYGNYALVYLRRKDEKSGREVAKKHARLLKPNGISAAIIREDGRNNIIYKGSDDIFNDDPIQQEKEDIEPALELEAKPEPPKLPDEDRKPAEEIDLEEQIHNYIAELVKSDILDPLDKVACSVYDFTTGEKLVSINEDEPLQCASMVKPLVALAFFHKAEQGEFIYGRRSRAKMESMIQMSGNSSTNWVIEQVGGPAKVQEILDTHYNGLFTKTNITEYIPQGGETYINRASARDYSRFLYAMWNGQLPYSREIRRLMALPNNDRVYRGAKKVPKGTLVYDKTGSTSYLIGNMAVLVAKGKNGRRYPYTLICAIERNEKAPDYRSWKKEAGDIIREISNKVYVAMKKKHDLI